MTNVIEQQIGETFVKDKNGIKTTVILCQVLRNKVMVRCPDRKDSFKMPVDEFLKKYKQVNKATA
jgi:hypothetical protein